MLTSCSSDDSSSDSNTETVLKPTKIVYMRPDNSVIYVSDFKYDGNKIVSTTDDDGYVMKYTYTGDVITKVEEFELITILKTTREFTYLNGKMVTETQKEPNDNRYFEIKYTYNPDGTISYNGKQINSAPGSIVTSSGKYTYKNGNLIKDEFIFNGQVTDEVLTEYDVKKNPMSNVLGMNLLLSWSVTASSNNVVKSTQYSTGYETTFSYLYNNNDFPIERKQFGRNGKLDIIMKYTY